MSQYTVNAKFFQGRLDTKEYLCYTTCEEVIILAKYGIVAFAFGAPAGVRCNQCLAHLAANKARELKAPVLTQLDIQLEPGIDVSHVDEKPGHPPPTLRIARSATVWAKRLELDELWVVAATPHLWRCYRDLVFAVREAGVCVTVRVAREVESYTDADWFCPDSTRRHTSSRLRWHMREGALKLMPFCVYRRIAS